MTREEAIKKLQKQKNEYLEEWVDYSGVAEAFDMAIEALKADPKDTVLCKDCKHYKPSAVADRKMCFRKDVDGIEVCYDFLPYDSCTYGERKENEE